MSSTIMDSPTPSSVSFVWSYMNLLSGGLYDCQDADDDSCSGGIASVHAFLRKYSDGIDEGSLIISRLDYQSVFVNMHPLNWGVNRLILHDRFHQDLIFAYRSLLVSTKDDTHIQQRDLSTLQVKDLPLLLGNVVVSTSNVWSQYTKNIHFDDKTGLAVVVIDDGERVEGNTQSKGSLNGVSQVLAVRGLLNFVAQENQARGCSTTQTTYNLYMQQHNRLNVTNSIGEEPTQTTNSDSPSTQLCWIPVVVYDDTRTETFEEFLDGMLAADNNPNPPALIAQVRSKEFKYPTPRQVGPHGTWIVSFRSSSRVLDQLRLDLSEDRRTVTNVTLIEQDLSTIPENLKDDQFRDDISFLRTLADEALENNPVRGTSIAMPPAKFPEAIEFAPCMGGECPIGNLFTDALRWWTGADFAFVNSGGIRGPGWPEGPVREGDIWGALPFANTQCTGAISGINLFRIFRESTTQATFQGEWTSTGDKLFQVSGIRYTYNTQLEAPRLVALEIWDDSLQQYNPVERLKMYKFATSSWMCSGFDPFPTMLTEELTVEGEEEARIGDTLLQNIVGDYLGYLEIPYEAGIKGRLVNDTSAMIPLDLIQIEESCNSTTYWVEKFLTCFDCPATDKVEVAGRDTLFELGSMSDEILIGQADIVNGEAFPVTVALKSKPEWVSVASDDIWKDGEGQKIIIAPGESHSFVYEVTASALLPGLVSGPLSFAVLDGGSYPGCVGRDALYQVSMKILNQPELNEPGSVMIVGFTLMGIVLFVALCLAAWVYRNKEKREVTSMQPYFLVALCFGVSVIGLSILPLSIRGLDVSPEGQNIACMATPWLLTMGFSVVLSTLMSKLWRINKLFHGRRFQRITLSARETFLAFAIILPTNLILMILWTLIDPLEYDIRFVEGEEWNLYSTCSSRDGQSCIFVVLAIVVNFIAMSLVMYEAYKARNISEKYSESKNLGIATFSWIQLILVGCPVMFLIDEDNVAPKYFLQTALIFVGCMSMLLIIFVPLLLRTYSKEESSNQRRTFRISGLNFSWFSEGGTPSRSHPLASRFRSIDSPAQTRSRDISFDCSANLVSQDMANSDEPDMSAQNNSQWSNNATASNPTGSNGSGDALSSSPSIRSNQESGSRRTSSVSPSFRSIGGTTRGDAKDDGKTSEQVVSNIKSRDHQDDCSEPLPMASSGEMTTNT